MSNNFFQQVYELVAQIPPGKVASYGQIAAHLGAPRMSRHVGFAMRCCPSDDIPWQRVVMRDGSVTGGEYAELRRGLLESEGVAFLPDGRVDMDICRWHLENGN